MADDTLGGAQNLPPAASAPTITVESADSTAPAADPPSNTSSPVPSYIHTPAEPYSSDFAHAASSAGLRQMLQKSAAQQGDSRDAAVASLQAEIDDTAMLAGSVWYLVGHKWFAAWQESASGLVPHDIGPIDNSEIVDANGELLPGLELNVDLDAVPASAWQKMAVLYGVNNQQSTVRRVAVQGDTPEKALLELYPPSVFVVSKGSLALAGSESTRRIVISLGASLAELKYQICRKFDLSISQEFRDSMRLFRPASERAGGAEPAVLDTPLKPPPYEAHMAGDKDIDLAIGAGSAGDESLEEITSADSALLMTAGILSDMKVVFETQPDTGDTQHAQPVALADDETLSDTNSTGLTALVSEMSHGGADERAKLPASGSDDMDAADTALVHSVVTAPQAHYLCGLNNLGNTCFMNSALQCLGHFSDLTQYFVSNVYTTELNRENPLGMKGAVASAYGRLVKAMWDIGRGAYAPRMFKQTIAQWAPQFRGYNQQDAPEFLAFLLDGMHEDLNRILHKPYIEVPDAGGRPDNVVADEQWSIYKRRNDSVVVDLFQGQYRSTLVCPVCSNVSVTFDPFMYLTLPLPIQRQKWIDVLFIPLDTAVYATQMHLLVRKDDTIKQLKQVAAHFVGCDTANMLACDIFSTRMYSIYSDSDSLGDIRETEVVHIYELGVDVARAAAVPSTEPGAVVQLLCSRPSSSSSYGGYGYGSSPELVAKPLMLTLPSSELTLGALYLQIANALSRWAAIDMSRIVSQLQIADKEGESDERLLELLGRAACLSVHRAAPPSQGQYRNLSSISSYMYPGRRSHGPPSAFRAFEDRITNDSCELLAVGKGKGKEAAARDDSNNSTSEPMSITESTATSAQAGPGRRRQWADMESESHSPKWDSSSDNDGDHAARGTPKRARSDNGSDSDVRNSSRTTPLFAPVSSEWSNIDDADPVQPPVQVAAADGKDEEQSSDDEMATAAAALSFADLMGTVVSFNTGDTLVCEWSDEGTKALLAELSSDKDVNTDVVSDMFDFDRVSEFAMPPMDDATQYKSLDPVLPLRLDQPPLKAERPAGDGWKQRQVTLEDCLAEFTRPEQLGEEDLWYCSKCKEHQQATKKFDLWRVPEILVVHLKRFQHSRAWRDKIDVLVDFPLANLDLTKTVAGPNGGELVYDLHSVCNHYGGMGGGHYTAYARNPEDQKWYDFNDSHVSPVSDSESVKTSAAYMLFYRLRSSGNSATAKIERLISEFKEAGAQPSMADDDMNVPSDASMLSPAQHAMDEDSDFSTGINALMAIRPGTSSPRSDLGNVSDMDADDGSASAPATPPRDIGTDYSSSFM
ncbi:hypothetical protein IWW55_000049 [Coemansia sp. RSA 2706]|nr:hypothetical protein LPJ63_000459 [Coemansia sp. RSA 2711]KAJ2308958.1 hypothetical protein IWW55_000049 [Coemansia sp. RSA 2706]KAJ2315744.1 hypothetical protein IWW54_000113 [Coemansia sp. RSA 2705]KAJ2322395.1 hypothetical protein IWW52_000043 [Coemansia sp. RSA 2704]KAJ2330182.1 hypothetical protein IWW51_000042 [Coemansia sp. RSA 2702]KAJ2739943.1 hypothetical protein H4R23_000041 [Coemansia sp. Cherry 401B]